MGRRNKSPEKKRSRALSKEYLKENPLKGTGDINDIVKELISPDHSNSVYKSLFEYLSKSFN